MKRLKPLIILLMSVLFAVQLLACDVFTGSEHLDAGMEALSIYDYDAALASFMMAEQNGEDERLVRRGIGIARMGQFMYEEALGAFEEALALSGAIPDRVDFDINYYMATAYYLSGQKERAIEVYDAILALRDDESDAYYLRGAILIEEGRTPEGLTDFDQALALYTGGSERLTDIYQILSAAGLRSVGDDYLRSALEDDEGDLSNFEKGRISFYLGDYENARMYLERGRDLSYEAVLYLGRTYEVLDDLNYAESVYKTYLEAGNESPEIYNQLGICRMKMSDYEGALDAFHAGMAITPNNILQTLRFNEIVAYEFLGDFKRAQVLMDGYLQEYPSDKAAERENYFLRSR